MIVLKIIGFILLGIFGLIIAALCIKVKIFAEYSEYDTNVKIKWLFLNIPVYPAKAKKKPQENAQTDSSATTETQAPAEEVSLTEQDVAVSEENSSEAENTNTVTDEAGQAAAAKPKNNFLKTLYNAHGIDGLLLIVRRVFRYLGTFTGNLMHSLVIEELYIDVRCHKNDAASTAIYYGEVCSSLFPMLGSLITKYKVRKYDINVYPDYLARTSSASFAVSMHLYPIYLVGITISLVCKMLFKVLLRLIVKCFLPAKNRQDENKNKKTDSTESAA